MGMKLFDDAKDDDVDEISNIEINKEFAKRYEHNKKREDLQKLDEMKKKGLISDSVSNSESDSESEFDEDDDDDDDNPKAIKKDLDFFDALLKVRKQDPILKDESAKLFESSSDEEEEEEDDERESGQGKKKEKEKPKYLKDVIAEHLIEDGPEFDEDEDEDEDEKKVKTYVEEQEDTRREVLNAMAEVERENDGDGGDLLKLKEREEEDDDGVGEGNEEFVKKLDEYFGKDEKLDENNKFLKDFFKNKMWVDKDKGKRPIEDDLEEISDDEDALEKQEEYERGFNFRFEENASDRIMGHSRVVEGSVRKETNARKQQRERKKERLAQAEAERREEVKRLKNLKKKEIQEKLNKIREIGGITGDSMPLTEEDLEEEFDPDEYDKKMKAAYGDNYYDAEDADPGFVADGDEGESDLEKPDFDKEDELLGLPKDWDVIKSNDGFLAEREKMLKSKASNEGGSDDDGDDDNDDQMKPREGKRKRKQKLSLKEKVALDKELEEMHKLDYEGSIGDLKTRFKYREVAPRKYGLTGAHILMIDDKELNQYVPLKKIAPYREKEWAPHRMQRMNIRLKGSLFEAAINGNMGRNKKRKTELGETSDRKGSGFQEDEKVRGEQPSNDESKLSRAARRRRNQKEKKLPPNRLAAYGKIPSSSKSKSKS